MEVEAAGDEVDVDAVVAAALRPREGDQHGPREPAADDVDADAGRPVQPDEEPDRGGLRRAVEHLRRDAGEVDLVGLAPAGPQDRLLRGARLLEVVQRLLASALGLGEGGAQGRALGLRVGQARRERLDLGLPLGGVLARVLEGVDRAGQLGAQGRHLGLQEAHRPVGVVRRAGGHRRRVLELGPAAALSPLGAEGADEHGSVARVLEARGPLTRQEMPPAEAALDIVRARHPSRSYRMAGPAPSREAGIGSRGA